MDPYTRLSWIILVFALLILLTSFFAGLVFIPSETGLESIPMWNVILLSICTLLCGFLRMKEIEEPPLYRRRSIVITVSSIAIMLAIILPRAGIYPPGMDPQVPYLFVIPPLALVIILAALIELVVPWILQHRSI